MASCKYNPGINSVNPYAVLTVTQASQNVATNKTKLNYDLKIYRPSAIQSSAPKDYSITINGTKVKSGTTTIGGSGTKTIASGTIEVAHDAAGEKTVSFSFSLEFAINWNGKWVGTGTANDSMKLSTIPRATTPKLTPSTQEIGKSITINLPKASNNFTHTLQHDFYANAWTTFATKNVSDSISFTFPTSWIEKIPNATSGGGRIRCLTYNGNTLIGEKIVNFKATVPSTVVPVINNVNITEAEDGIYSKFGTFVQNKSKFKIAVTASGVEGSTIKSCSVTVNGVTYSGTNITTDVITVSGSVSISVKVTDSRGRTATTERTVALATYNPPRIDAFSVIRGDANGEPDADGTYALIRINFTISPVNQMNDNSYKIEYRVRGSSSWTMLGTYSGYNYNSTFNGGNILNADNMYEFLLTVTDYFDSVTAEDGKIPTSFTLIDFHRSGNSIAFGGVSTRTDDEKAVDFKMETFDRFGARINNGMSRYTGSGDRAIDPDTTTDELILTDVNTPNGKFMYITTVFYIDKSETANRAQTAIPYNANGSMYHRYFSGGMWSPWRRHVNEDEIQQEHFLTLENHKDVITVGNLRGGVINNIHGVRYGKVVQLYIQINGITSGGSDVEIFRLKNSKYFPAMYAVHCGFVSKENNICYIGQFNDGHFTMAINGSGVINASNKAMVLCTFTYITN